jgi:DNA-binding LytR/AlgR family response regulator
MKGGAAMLRVAICDDQPIFVERLNEQLSTYADQNEAVIAIHRFSSGIELLSYNEPYDLLFLDIDMPELDGMAVAKILRNQNAPALIVFVSSHKEHVFNAFEVKAFRFLVKPTQQADVDAVIAQALQEIQVNKPNLIVVELSSCKLIQLPTADILYIEALGKSTYIRTVNESYETRMPLKHFEQTLCLQDFYRTHKSYLVNLKQVQSHTQQEIIMLSGDKVHLSRLKVSAFKKAFIQVLKGSL